MTEGGGRIAIGDRTPHAALAAKHTSRTQGGKVHVHFACCRVPCMVPCRAATIEDIEVNIFSFVSPVRTYLTWRATIGRQPRNSPLRGAQGAVHWSVLAALLTAKLVHTHTQTRR
jgi:hypothetical protein